MMSFKEWVRLQKSSELREALNTDLVKAGRQPEGKKERSLAGNVVIKILKQRVLLDPNNIT